MRIFLRVWQGAKRLLGFGRVLRTKQIIPPSQTSKLKKKNISVDMLITRRTKATIENKEKENTGDNLEQEETLKFCHSSLVLLSSVDQGAESEANLKLSRGVRVKLQKFFW